MELWRHIQNLILALPETAAWPELAEVFARTKGTAHPDWELPLITCRAAGGNDLLALPGAAALACLLVSIMLVDDMLDDDPRGEHLQRGVGPAANLAQAFQAAAIRVVADAEVCDSRRAALMACIAQAALATAVGQHLDVQNFSGEENYWRVVRAKSTPFYGAAYQLGGIFAGADAAVTEGLYELGVIVGEIIQIEDDLADALEEPANADWQQGRNNLLILYGRTADHAQRIRFETLLPLIKEPTLLQEAQTILISSGAVSYAAYHLVNHYQKARELLMSLRLPNPEPLEKVLERFASENLTQLLQTGGQKVPPEMLRQALI